MPLTGLFLAGLGFKLAGGLSQAKAARDAADARAEAHLDQANRLREFTDFEIALEEKEQGRFTGSQLAAIGASGLAGGISTAGDLLDDTAMQQALDILTLRYQSEADIYSQGRQASIVRQEGRARARAQTIGTIGSGLLSAHKFFKG